MQEFGVHYNPVSQSASIPLSCSNINKQHSRDQHRPASEREETLRPIIPGLSRLGQYSLGQDLVDRLLGLRHNAVDSAEPERAQAGV